MARMNLLRNSDFANYANPTNPAGGSLERQFLFDHWETNIISDPSDLITFIAEGPDDREGDAGGVRIIATGFNSSHAAIMTQSYLSFPEMRFPANAKVKFSALAQSRPPYDPGGLSTTLQIRVQTKQLSNDNVLTTTRISWRDELSNGWTRKNTIQTEAVPFGIEVTILASSNSGNLYDFHVTECALYIINQRAASFDL